MARVSLDVSQPWDVTLPVTDVYNAAHLDFVAEENAVVYSDRRLNQIRWVHCAIRDQVGVTDIVLYGIRWVWC